MASINLVNVKKYMEENNYSELEMARLMNISYSYLFRVFRGKRQPGRKFIEGLFKAGMKPEEIFLRSALPNGNSKETASR